MQAALKRLNSRVIYNAHDVVWQAVPDFNSAMDKTSSWRTRSWFRFFQGMAWHTQACAGCLYWAVGTGKHGFRGHRLVCILYWTSCHRLVWQSGHRLVCILYRTSCHSCKVKGWKVLRLVEKTWRNFEDIVTTKKVELLQSFKDQIWRMIVKPGILKQNVIYVNWKA